MSTLFRNILAPVDFSENTDVAVEKIIELAEPLNSEIHLFHVDNSSPRSFAYAISADFDNTPVSKNCNSAEIEIKLQQYKDKIIRSLPMSTVNLYMAAGGGVQRNIIKIAKALNIQFIIISKRKKHGRFTLFNTVNSSCIAKKTGSVVLTVKPGAVSNQMKAIVLPVRSFFPQRKIELLKALTEKNRAKIYLVTMPQKNAKAGAFVDTFRTISEYMHYPVEYKILEGNNFPKAIFEYAKRVRADVILTNPYAETKINRFYGTDICDLISPYSKLAVLTVEPLR